MTKAIFFDWFDTLAHYYPPREETRSRACLKAGIRVSQRRLAPGIILADHYYIQENNGIPVKQRPLEEQAEIFAHMERIVLAEAGIQVTDEQLGIILQEVSRTFSGNEFMLFDDVLPAFQALKQQNILMGIISNIDRSIDGICRDLGLEPYLDLTVTSSEVGSGKPHAPIYLAALERAGVEAAESIYVGDHHETDILGAERVGMKGVLLDRYDSFTSITSCPRINTLPQLLDYV